jgi:PAS domain S-box-containing protein
VNSSSSNNGAVRSVSGAFRAVMDAAQVAVMAAAENGFYVYGNRAAKALLGYDTDQLRCRHLADLHVAERALFEAEFDRLKRERAWSGRVMLRRSGGEVVRVAVNAFVSSLPDGSETYVCLTRPVAADGCPLEGLPCAGACYGLAANDIRLLQLAAEGFANKEIAGILGMSTVAVENGLRAILRKMSASSRTEACVMALKAHIIL